MPSPPPPGHPIGATGAVLIACLLHAMQRDGEHRGNVTLCINGEQGGTHGGQWEDQSHRQGVEDDDRQVVWPALAPAARPA